MPDLRPTVSQEALLALLHDQFDVPVFDVPVFDVAPLEGGPVARSFGFRASDQEYIIRFNLDRMLGANFPKEAYLWQKLDRSSIPMPPVLQVGRLGELHYAITRKMPGVPLMRLKPAEIAALFPQIMGMLDTLHSIDIGDTHGSGVFDDHGRGMTSSWHAFLRQIAEEEQPDDYFGAWHHLFNDTFLEREVFDCIYDRMVRLLPYCPGERHLAHGSLCLASFLSDRGQLTAVLDWLDARYGDFIYDSASLDFWTPALQVQERVRMHYQERQILVPAYEERMLCYQCYVALGAMRFYAMGGQKQNYETVRARILERL
jgi:hygromycin-B 4-O-kinase